MASQNWPNFQGLIASQWGGGIEGFNSFFGAGSNIVFGTNPPYGVTDLFTFYPKFGGPTMPLSGTLNGGVLTVTTGPIPQGISAGWPITGPGIPSNTTIVSFVDTTTPPDPPSYAITLSNAGMIGGAITLTVYNPALYSLPAPILNAYIALASASLVQARWQDTWAFAMALYAMHFATLYLRSDGSTCNNPGRAAAAGLARGITVSKSVDGVSQTIQLPTGLEDWGAWQETTYGELLATFAKSVGAGPCVIY